MCHFHRHNRAKAHVFRIVSSYHYYYYHSPAYPYRLPSGLIAVIRAELMQWNILSYFTSIDLQSNYLIFYIFHFDRFVVVFCVYIGLIELRSQNPSFYILFHRRLIRLMWVLFDNSIFLKTT